MTLTKPYFMQNAEWYKFDKKRFKYILTDKAPKKAIASYNEFYKLLDKAEYGAE